MSVKRTNAFIIAGCCMATLTIAVLSRNSRPVHGQQQAATMQLQADGPQYKTAKVTAAGTPPIYDFTGNPIVGARCAQGVVMTDNTGSWSVNYASLAFTTAITRADVSAAAPSTSNIVSLTGMYQVSFSTPTLTSMSGRVTIPATVVVGGMAIAFATTPTPVYVAVCGS